MKRLDHLNGVIYTIPPKLQTLCSLVLGRQADICIQEFPGGATIGLYVTSGNTGHLYNDMASYKNVKATSDPGEREITWRQTPEIRLDAEKATIYAYYPYQAGIDFNARQIPVRIAPDASGTNDYMYG